MKRKGFVAVVSVIAAATFVFSLYMIVTTLITRAQEQSAFDELAAAVEQQREQADVPDSKPEQITSLDSACYEGCGNYILYGHHMKNETMFGTLPKYADKEYWEQHRTLCFDTLYKHGEYEVIAAFYDNAVVTFDSGG